MSETPSGAGTAMPVLAGLSEWADRYDGYILDLWGVIHNGLEPYPGVLDCLARLKQAGKRTCLLSNAPRRVADVVARLEEIGVPRRLYDEVLSSGEAAHRAIADPPDDFHARLGRRCWHLGPPRDDSVHAGLDLTLVDAPEAADFVLNTGADGYDDTLEDYVPALEAAARCRLPMICANPDLTVMMGDKIAICAGLLARHYEGLGGRVAYHGKPHPPIYRQCLALLGDMPPPRILAVGDNFLTDIAGANRAGLASLLVTGGIHGAELVGPDGRTPDPEKVRHLAASCDARPDGAIAGLTW
ncbi:MAG: TIGR01459 family HAD-type hydrolase [Alphaproteobacteria bacterium]|jgi:HAD superfamily hydrolase (TIGR01459 family)|nr:TIGR01459 family HAD-type hydrolase [Alphaproteobacteria bacterium]